MLKRISLIFIFSLLSNPLLACEEKRDQVGETIVEQGYFSSSKTCWVGLRQAWPKDLIYRSYMFTSKGLVMVFNSFGEGPDNTNAGASEFYLFPVSAQVGYQIVDDQIMVTLADGRVVEVEDKWAEPRSITGLDIEIDPKVHPENQGGVSILAQDQGLRLEAGFRLGMSPTWFLDRPSDLVDSRNQRCRIKNSEFFKRVNGDTALRYPTTAELRRFVSRRCSQLRF